MNDVTALVLWVVIAVVSFFAGAAWGLIRAFTINTTVNVNGEHVTIQRELKGGFNGPKPLGHE